MVAVRVRAVAILVRVVDVPVRVVAVPVRVAVVVRYGGSHTGSSLPSKGRKVRRKGNSGTATKGPRCSWRSLRSVCRPGHPHLYEAPLALDAPGPMAGSAAHLRGSARQATHSSRGSKPMASEAFRKSGEISKNLKKDQKGVKLGQNCEKSPRNVLKIAQNHHKSPLLLAFRPFRHNPLGLVSACLSWSKSWATIVAN